MADRFVDALLRAAMIVTVSIPLQRPDARFR
jgi:hypothetical protein